MIDPTVMLSTHVSVATFTKSTTAPQLGIDNGLPEDLLARAQGYCTNLFEKMRTTLGDQPINVHSGFRCLALNTALKGSPTSDHMVANAMDFDCNNRMTLPQAFKMILQSDLKWKQFMLEGVTAANPKGGWLHIAYDTDLTDDQQRMDIKVVNFNNGQPAYQEVTLEQALAWCDQQS